MITESARRAMAEMATGPYSTPAQIGYAMCSGRDPPLKAQGAGRIGSSMAVRLIKAGLAEDVSSLRGGFPAYRLTARGRKVRQEPS